MIALSASVSLNSKATGYIFSVVLRLALKSGEYPHIRIADISLSLLAPALSEGDLAIIKVSSRLLL